MTTKVDDGREPRGGLTPKVSPHLFIEKKNKTTNRQERFHRDDLPEEAVREQKKISQFSHLLIEIRTDPARGEKPLLGLSISLKGRSFFDPESVR